MTNRNTIIEKLWNDKTLSSEEIMYISKNITDDNKPITFDPQNQDFVLACGVSQEDIDDFNVKFHEMAQKDPIDTDVALVQRIESFAADPRHLRIITIQCARYAMENQPKKRRNSLGNNEKNM